MNRLKYLLVAQTQYNIHSPAIFDLYNQVLNARVNPILGIEDRLLERIYMLVNYFGFCKVACGKDMNGRIEEVRRVMSMANSKATLCATTDEDIELLIVGAGEDVSGVSMNPNGVVVVINPRKNESWWTDIDKNMGAKVSIDMYDWGLLLFDKRLHEQKFILR